LQEEAAKENKDILTKNAQRFWQDKIVKRMPETSKLYSKGVYSNES
jgi:hypothetical protein